MNKPRRPAASLRTTLVGSALAIFGVLIALDVVLASANLLAADPSALRRALTILAVGEGAVAYIAVGMAFRAFLYNGADQGSPSKAMVALETAVGLALFFLIAFGLPPLALS